MKPLTIAPFRADNSLRAAYAFAHSLHAGWHPYQAAPYPTAMPYSSAQPGYKSPKLSEIVQGSSGREYSIQSVLQDKQIPFGRVYLATCVATSAHMHGCWLSSNTKSSNESRNYVLREIPQDLEIRASIYHRIGRHPNVRALIDTVPDRRMFVFRHLNENLLGFVQRDLSLKLIERILKCALQGLAALHEQDLVHNDIKANNIMIQTKECSRDTDVQQVQLVDLEDTVHLPPGRATMGIQVGNWMWRSPEAHAQGPVEKSSDMFSFGLVCIYAMTQRLVLAVDESELLEGEDKLAIVLERQLSYFADESGFKAFMQYIGAESAWHEIFRVINSGFGKDQPRKPFALWDGNGLDGDFKAFIGGLTNFDPAKRMTAQQALAHRWLENV